MARIAVIGAGVGAMAAAARLAVAGHEVEVHERSDTYGGSLGQYRRDGFAFDTGPGLLTLPAVPRDLFLKTGRAALEDPGGGNPTPPARGGRRGRRGRGAPPPPPPPPPG
ncbi:NAD(P)-binding protein, partial [Streptomyces diastaticus]